jgi:hypothetical protein
MEFTHKTHKNEDFTNVAWVLHMNYVCKEWRVWPNISSFFLSKNHVKCCNSQKTPVSYFLVLKKDCPLMDRMVAPMDTLVRPSGSWAKFYPGSDPSRPNQTIWIGDLGNICFSHLKKQVWMPMGGFPFGMWADSGARSLHRAQVPIGGVVCCCGVHTSAPLPCCRSSSFSLPLVGETVKRTSCS